MITLTNEQRQQIIALLGELCVLESSVIETAIVAETGKTMCREDARAVARARRNVRQAERMVRILHGRK